jgi:Flp pilus assembly protein TadD
MRLHAWRSRAVAAIVPLDRNDREIVAAWRTARPAAVAARRTTSHVPCHHRGMEPAMSDDGESAYDLLQRGHALLEHRHFAQAAIVLERADRLEPGKGSILEALGRAYFNSAQAERARATFEALLEIDPTSHYAHYAVGQCLKRLGRIDRARTHLRLAMAMSPNNELYSGALGRLPPPRKPRHPLSTDDPSS